MAALIPFLFIQTKRDMEFKGRNGNYAHVFCNYTRRTPPVARCEPGTTKRQLANKQVSRKGTDNSGFSCLLPTHNTKQLFSCGLMSEPFIIPDYTVSSGRTAERSWHIAATIQTPVCRGKRNLCHAAAVPAEIRIHGLPNTSQQNHRWTDLLCSKKK
jgi:hypothetical protein